MVDQFVARDNILLAAGNSKLKIGMKINETFTS